MKLLIICPDWFPVSAGLAQSCLEFCQEAKKNGHEIRIITAADNNLDPKGFDVRGLPYLFRLGGKSPIIFNYWKKLKPHVAWSDKVILYSYMFEMNSRVTIFKKLGLFKKPLLHMYRGSLENDVLRGVSFPIKLMKWTWDVSFGRLMFTWVDKTVSNSKPTLQTIKKRYGVGGKKTAYVPSGFHLTEYKKSKQNTKRIFFLGRLVENKGVYLFEDIIKSLPSDWTFTIVGNGPLTPVVEDLAKKYANIDYQGRLPPEKFIPLLADSAILVLPTFAEGSPRIVTEAMASGVVPISFDAGDVPTILNGKNGFSVKMFDIKTFCKKLRLLIFDGKLRKQMAVTAYVDAKQYAWPKIYKKLEKELDI